MSIHTLRDDVYRVGPVAMSLVEVRDDKTGDKTVDYEVTCDLGDCNYMATHLTEAEAREEVDEHVKTHAPKVKDLALVKATWATLHQHDLIVSTDDVVDHLRMTPDKSKVIAVYVGGTESEPMTPHEDVEVMRERTRD